MGAIQTPIIQDPGVGFRLDPDEPGVAKPTTARNAIFTVVGQESRNRARLKSEALREGRQVLLVKTDYKIRQTGSFLAVVGGTTTVVTKSRPEEEKPATALAQAAAATESGRDENARELATLRAEQQRLEGEHRDLERVEESGDAVEAAQAELRLTQIELRLEEIEEELGRLGIPSGAENAPAGPAFAANGFTAALNAAGNLLDLSI